MKIYISADIEGTSGATSRNEVFRGSLEYEVCRKQMTKEVAAACQGALDAGAHQIVVKDAHGDGQNISAADLPAGVQLIKGWSGHPYSMMQELDQTFNAVLMIGYHAKGGAAGNPLAHTMNSRRISQVTINKQIASEFMINALTARIEEIPVPFISGDRQICSEATELIPGITTVISKDGVGGSTINQHPNVVAVEIKQGVKEALEKSSAEIRIRLPQQFDIVIEFIDFKDAYCASFYPNAKSLSPRSISFSTDDYFEVLRLFSFVF